VVATNLAKVLWAQGNEEEARVQLREALTLDPNLENALAWWASIHGSEGGDAAYQESLREIAGEPGAWRARLLLARQYVQHGRLDLARDLLDALLAEHGHDPEIRRQVEGEMETLQAAEPALRPHVADRLRMASVPLFAPVWTRALDDPDWILPPWPETERSPAVPICVFAFADARRGLGAPEFLHAMAETAHGRLTRALPLVLAESLMLRTDARVATVIPVVLNGGLFLSTAPFTLDTMLGYCPPVFSPRFVIGGTFLDHDVLRLEMWDVERREAVWTHSLPSGDPVDLARRMDALVRGALVVVAGARPRQDEGVETLAPAPADLSEAYLHAQGWLLAQVLAASRVISPATLPHEAQMYPAWFGLCGLYPRLLFPRLMAIAGVLSGLAYGSPQAGTYRESVRALLSEHGPHAALLERLSPLVLRRLGDVEGALAAGERLRKTSDLRYLGWLEKVSKRAVPG
jgi:hypothetical protein